MNAKELLDQLLNATKKYAEKGQDIVEEKLDIPKDGEAREDKLENIKKTAIIAGAAALLLGTKSGRSVTGAAIKLGSLAAVGGFAYQAYQNWQNGSNTEIKNEVAPLEKKTVVIDSEKSLVLLKAIISAAKADGHINESELKTIHLELNKLELELDIDGLIQNTASDPQNIAALVDSIEFAAEVYLVSSLMLDHSNEVAKTYLDNLAAALKLPDEMIQALSNNIH